MFAESTNESQWKLSSFQKKDLRIRLAKSFGSHQKVLLTSTLLRSPQISAEQAFSYCDHTPSGLDLFR